MELIDILIKIELHEYVEIVNLENEIIKCGINKKLKLEEDLLNSKILSISSPKDKKGISILLCYTNY